MTTPKQMEDVLRKMTWERETLHRDASAAYMGRYDGRYERWLANAASMGPDRFTGNIVCLLKPPIGEPAIERLPENLAEIACGLAWRQLNKKTA